MLCRDFRDIELLWLLSGEADLAIGSEIEERVEFREEDREADLEWKCDLGTGGDWNWSQNISGDSGFLSRELEGLTEAVTCSLTCSIEIWAASWNMASGPREDSLAEVST